MPHFLDPHMYNVGNPELWVAIGLVLFFAIVVVAKVPALVAGVLASVRHLKGSSEEREAQHHNAALLKANYWTNGWFNVATFQEPGWRIEGKKTLGLEMAEPPPGETRWSLPDAIVYPTGGGTGVIPGSQQDFLNSVSSDRIFFGFDQYNVDAEDQATLSNQAQWLQRNSAVRVLLEGHADERGTRDYNLALGERRANAAKNYLASLGIDASRIQTVSHGKEKPAAQGASETDLAKNRRVEIKY